MILATHPRFQKERKNVLMVLICEKIVKVDERRFNRVNLKLLFSSGRKKVSLGINQLDLSLAHSLFISSLAFLVFKSSPLDAPVKIF